MPRTTSALLLWMIFLAYLLLRRFGGPGSDKLAAGMALFGMANAPFVYVSVNYWRTLHPKTTVHPIAGAADGRADVVLHGGVRADVDGAVHAARAAGGAARPGRSPLSRCGRGMMRLIVPSVLAMVVLVACRSTGAWLSRSRRSNRRSSRTNSSRSISCRRKSRCRPRRWSWPRTLHLDRVHRLRLHAGQARPQGRRGSAALERGRG